MFEVLSGNRLRLSWPTVIGKKYQLESAEQLVNGFANVASSVFPLKATSTNQTYEINLPIGPRSTNSQFFFRVRLIE